MLRPDITIEGFHERQVGFAPDRFGVRITALAEGHLDSQMEVQPWMLAPNGFLHAASVIMLADTSAGYATIAHLPEGGKNFTTIELKSNFFSTAKEGLIRCEARADHLGRSTQVWSATVFSPQGKKMALFRCTQIILN
jgi:1,4-dihydroxy-2-naphthoyl-CoA hydrolase